MWNSRNHAAVAIVGAGLAVAAATPASAWWWPGYGGYYAAPYGYGIDGYSGAYSNGWPRASDGYTDYLSYGYGGDDYDYGPAYGYAGYSYTRPWRALGCGSAAYHPRGYNYAVAYHHPVGSAVAPYRLRRACAVTAYSPRSYPHVDPPQSTTTSL